MSSLRGPAKQTLPVPTRKGIKKHRRKKIRDTVSRKNRALTPRQGKGALQLGATLHSVKGWEFFSRERGWGEEGKGKKIKGMPSYTWGGEDKK